MDRPMNHTSVSVNEMKSQKALVCSLVEKWSAQNWQQLGPYYYLL